MEMATEKEIARVKKSNRELAKRLSREVRALEKKHRATKGLSKKNQVQNKLWELRARLQRAATIGSG